MDDSTYQLAICIPVKDLYLLCGSLYSLPFLVPGQIFGLQSTEEMTVYSPQLTQFGEALETFAQRTCLVLRFNTRCPGIIPFLITSFTTPINTFLAHYII